MKRYPDGTEVHYEYYELTRLTSLTEKQGTITYEYNIVGNKTQMHKQRRGLEGENGAYQYDYDVLGRLISVSQGGIEREVYEYDPFGNRTRKKEGSQETAYTYNTVNQLIFKVDQQGESRYTYDKRGNLIQTLSGGIVTNQYFYGAMNRLSQAINQKGEIARYHYNGLSHRVKTEFGIASGQPQPYLENQMEEGFASANMVKQESFVPVRQVEDTIDLTREYHNLLQRKEDHQTQIYLWDREVVGASQVGRESFQGYYLQDDLGSPVRIVDNLGEIRASYGYGVFGEDLYEEQEQVQPFGYTGYQRDGIANTCYAQAREYVAEIGRFISEDWIKGEKQNPITFNKYLYAFDNPCNFLDQNGKWAISLKGSANLTVLLGVGVDIDVSFDDNGNIALQWSYCVPFVKDTMSIGFLDAGIAGQLQYMNVDSVFDLEGKASYVGASGGYLGYLGLDGVTLEPISDMNDESIEGLQVQVGAGIGIDVHLSESRTSTLLSTHVEWMEELFEFLGIKDDKEETNKCNSE